MMEQTATPEDKEFNLNRREPRLPCNPTGVRAYLKSLERQFTGNIVEVSRTGIQLQIDEAVPTGSVMTVEFGGTVLEGEVRHCEFRDGRFTVGIQTADVWYR
ncbi:MAG TPA: PilZ domain-containing protein [Bryobacteraceae bacterium]|nr:PilZ domain-containing protein [Bryobacteraceae bacterium]